MYENNSKQQIVRLAKQNQNENLSKIEIQSVNLKHNQLIGPLNEEISSQIFKMDIDCFEELFDYLSVYDILSLRLTCKRFKKVIDYYIRTNYLRLKKFRVQARNVNMFRRMDESTIEWINKITVTATDSFYETKLPFLQKCLNKVEKIEIWFWKLDPDFYNCFIKYCNNVKWLSIKRNRRYCGYISISNEWLSHQYPSIEYFNIDYILKGEVDDYVKFFNSNPYIHAFSIQLGSLNEIGSRFVEAGIQFDRLCISSFSIDQNSLIGLKRLYDAGFYKRLCITCQYTNPNDEGTYLKLASVGMEVLSVESMNFIIPPLPGLKELNIDGRCNFNEKYENVRNVIERISCEITYSNDILAFISYFPKLKHFQIKKMNDAYKLNLFALNKERENLPGACKTTIYINEKVYLATKWATMQTNFNLIELKRIHSCDWDRFFENDCGICGPVDMRNLYITT